MAHFPMLLTSVVTVAAMAHCAASAQSSPKRTVAPIDWATYEAEAKASAANNKDFLTSFRSTIPDTSGTHLPVLVPAQGPVRAAPRFRSQGTSYVAAYMLNGAKLSVLGSISAISVDKNGYKGKDIDSNVRSFDISEDGADLSLQRYNATYVLRITCGNSSDERCTKEDFLQSVANTLIPVGGSQ